MEMTTFMGFTLQQILVYAGVGLGVIVLLVIIKNMFFKKKVENPNTRKLKCKNCGWFGDVSKYNPVCPKCNTKG